MPEDTSPHGGEALHPLPDRAKIPQPKPSPADDPLAGRPASRDEAVKDDAESPEIAQRPALPAGAPRMAADNEDREADRPAGGDGGDPKDTGKPSATRQPG